MKFWSWGPCLGLVCLEIGACAYETGAPVRQCVAMTPYHYPGGDKSRPRFQPETNTAPYTVSAEKQADQAIKMTLNGTTSFRGFFVQAREEADKTKLVPGTFTVSGRQMHTVGCGNIASTAITHRSKAEKTEIVSTWNGPAGYKGKVVFRATVVQRYEKFWLEIYSVPFEIDIPGVMQTTKRPPEYDRCGVTVSCLGLSPSGCEQIGNCGVLLTYQADTAGVLFELTVRAASDNMWAACGLAETPQMSPAHVIECVLNNGTAFIRESWNSANYVNSLVTVPTPGITFRKMSFADGKLTCSWHRAHDTTVQNTNFNTLNNTYYIILASGQLAPGTTDKRKHNERIASSKKLDLNVVETGPIGPSVDMLVKMHGSLMVISWVLLVGPGIILARHFKDSWPADTLCGQKVWFALHRGIMLTSVCLMVMALGIIFYRIGGWSPINSLHSILGVICCPLAIAQPITAFFRCHPGDEKRYIFNWAHWLSGNAAHFIALTTIFLSTGLDKAKLKSNLWFVYLLSAFVIFYTLVQAFLQVYAVSIRRAQRLHLLADEAANEPDANQEPAPAAGQGPAEPGAASSGSSEQETVSSLQGADPKLLALGVYVILSTLVVAALLSMIWLGAP